MKMMSRLLASAGALALAVHPAFAAPVSSGGQPPIFLGTTAGTAAAGNDSRITNALRAQGTTLTNDLAIFCSISGNAGACDANIAVGNAGHALCALDDATGCNFTKAPTVNGTPLGGGAAGSMIVNGDMDIDQQFEGASNGTGIDRWAYSYSTGSGLSLQRINDAPVGYARSLKATASTTAVIPAAADIRVIRTLLEGSSVGPLAWGTSNGQGATLSFQVKCSVAGTYANSFANSTPNYSYVTTYSVPSAGVWTPITETIPAPPTGSPWSSFVANQYAMSVRFDVGTGSNNAAANTNQWQSGNFYTATGATELVSTASSTCQWTAVHLYAGSAQGQYIPRPYAQEIALAQRYYRKTFNEGTAPAQNAGFAGSLCTRTAVSNSYVSWYLGLPSGIYTGSGSSPTVTTYNPAAANASARDKTASADVAVIVDPATAKGGSGVEIAATATAPAPDDICVHAVFNAGFN